MTYQYINLGTAPSGAGGDTFRSTGTKVNENFTNNTHAASRYVGVLAGNLMEVGTSGLGLELSPFTGDSLNKNGFGCNLGDTGRFPHGAFIHLNYGAYGFSTVIGSREYGNGQLSYYVKSNGNWSGVIDVLDTRNTTVDSNGFVKKASPIVKIYAEKFEANNEAKEQNPAFEKVGIGYYLIKNTLGFAKESWWIEVPTDTNGNRICAVEYQTLENGDLEIKTFKKKLNDEGDIVANLDAPIDIPNNANGEPRWIDVRLHSVNKPVVHKIPRIEKQARMVQQVKYAPQLTYITKYEDLFDDAGNPVIVDGQKYQKPVTHIQTDKNGTPILSNQPVINDKGEPVFEWVQALDSEDQPIFDDVPVLDDKGNQIFDEVTYEPQQ